MLFNSFVFLCLFLPVTYVAFWLLRTASARHVWLTITGYVFYGYWDARFCLLMAFSTTVSYLAGRGFLRSNDRSKDTRRRRLYLVVPIVTDLALLGFFKYANFAMDTGSGIARFLGWDVHPSHLNIVLPVGISFYTFHTITYIVDSYRGVIRPTERFFEFAAYVSLFSQLVAGPIVRFRQIEQDLQNLGEADRRRWFAIGVSFFVIGLIEKVIVADTLAALVDPALARYATLSTAGAWVAVLGYSFQLYFDFSGYSDMAVGLGYLFGLRIPQNFNSPYKALDPSDFWRRWHISLSSCLRDYVYVPLGGNRDGEWRTYRNLMLTMLIGGLWHGASWTFVFWGAYHGALLSLYRRFAAQWDAAPAGARQVVMFLLVVVGWVFFRSTSFGMAATLLHRMFVPTAGGMLGGVGAFLVALAIAGWWGMFGRNAFEIHANWRWRPRYAFAIALGLGACVAVMAGAGSSPFLYFQF